MAAQPIVVEATSGRSKCKACRHLGTGDPTIEMGSMRVGIPGHAAGVTVYHWCHPTCFAQHCLRVDLAPTGRAKCKADGGEISKGSVRLLIGYKKESTVYKIENANRTIVPQLLALAGRANMPIHGLGELPLDERLRAERLIYDGGSAGSTSGGRLKVEKGPQQKSSSSKRKRASPTASATKEAAPTKKAAVSKTTGRRTPAVRSRQKKCEADDDGYGELCD